MQRVTMAPATACMACNCLCLFVRMGWKHPSRQCCCSSYCACAFKGPELSCSELVEASNMLSLCVCHLMFCGPHRPCLAPSQVGRWPSLVIGAGNAAAAYRLLIRKQLCCDHQAASLDVLASFQVIHRLQGQDCNKVVTSLK